jgi:hemoglobin
MQITEGLDEPRLARLVSHFDSHGCADPLLGPLFNRAIVDWSTGLERLATFWSSVRLTTGRYRGQPLPVHLFDQTELSSEMFGRWLEFWENSPEQRLTLEAAVAVITETAAPPTICR